MKYKIKDTTDATGANVSLWHSDILAQNKDVCGLYMDAMSFLVKKRWAMSPFHLVTNSHKVIWVENEAGTPMGGVVYEYHPTNFQGYIVLIFVDDNFRGRHLYTLLQTALEDEVIRLGGTSIASMAHKDNVARLRAGEREGMLPEYHRLYKDLTPTLEERKAQLQKSTGKPWDQLNKDRWNNNK